ncbi:MAG TPA: hypothetical protein VHR45_18035 [Thermoanaerobaculia bacterium]|nr:hypothetical protein [Thermoanaerobaculia bacterium]
MSLPRRRPRLLPAPSRRPLIVVASLLALAAAPPARAAGLVVPVGWAWGLLDRAAAGALPRPPGAGPLAPPPAGADSSLPLDERRLALGAVQGPMDLYQLPDTPGPWTALARTSGVRTDRADLTGGYAADRVGAFIGPGSTSDESVVRIDGFEVGAAGQHGFPVGFGVVSADEIQVSTGGGDITALAPGLEINLIQKRGTNEWRASGRVLATGGALAGATPPVHGLAARQTAAREDLSANRVRDAKVFGLESGGPLVRDRLWLWGSFDRTQARETVFGGQPVGSLFEQGAAKLNAQLLAGDSAVFAWNRGEQSGSGLDAGPERAPETTLEHRALASVLKLEDTAIFSPRSYATAAAGLIHDTTRDVPAAGLGDYLRIDSAGVAHGSWFARGEDRRTRAATLSASELLGGGAVTHELQAGAEWRRTAGESSLAAPGGGRSLTAGQNFGLDPNIAVLELFRGGAVDSTVERGGLWASDTLTWGGLAATAGLRYEVQTLANRPSAIAGNPFEPLLAAVDFAGNGAGGVRWTSWLPRLAATYAAGRERRWVLRGSLSRYASLLASDIAARVNPAAPASASYYVYDPDRDLTLDSGEHEPEHFWYSSGFDPRLPPGVSPNAIDSKLGPELTDEAIAGAEYAFAADGRLGFYATYRRISHVLEEHLLARDSVTGQVLVPALADWVPAGWLRGQLPDGSAYNVPYYDLRPGLTATGGTLLDNGNLRQQFVGLTLEGHKRLAQRWMARGYVNWQNWTRQFGRNYRRTYDPTFAQRNSDYLGQPVTGRAGLLDQSAIYLSSRWSFNLSGLVQLPAGWNAAAAVNGRQGFPLPYFRQAPRPNAGPVEVLLTDRLDSFRGGDLVSLDARLDKELELRRGDVGLSLSLEALNLLNAGTVLRRQTDLGVSRANFVDEVMAPRLFRLGLRIHWR